MSTCTTLINLLMDSPRSLDKRVYSTKTPHANRASQTKESQGKHSTSVATQPYQGLSINFLFSCMKSANLDRRKDYEGIDGKTAWIIASNHFTGMKHGDKRISKATPLHWLEHFFS